MLHLIVGSGRSSSRSCRYLSSRHSAPFVFSPRTPVSAASPREETEDEIQVVNPQVGFYPIGLTMAPSGSMPPGPSAPSLSGPSRDKGLFYSGMAPLTLEDFMGPAHSRAFVAGLGRRLAFPLWLT